MANQGSPAFGYSSSSSGPVFPEPPRGSYAEGAAQALLRGLNRSTQSFPQHYEQLPDAPDIPDLPADAYNPYPEGFDLNQQLQNERAFPIAGAMSDLRNAYQSAGNMGLPKSTMLNMQLSAMGRARAAGEAGAQNYVKGLLPVLSSHKLGAYSLQGQRLKQRAIDQYLGRMGIAAQNYQADSSRAAGFGGPLASLLGSKQSSRSKSYFQGPTTA